MKSIKTVVILTKTYMSEFVLIPRAWPTPNPPKQHPACHEIPTPAPLNNSQPLIPPVSGGFPVHPIKPPPRNTPRLFAFHQLLLFKPNTRYTRAFSTMPRRILTAEERQHVNAFNEALETALSQVNSKDTDGRFRVEAEVEKTHPLSQEVREAWALERLSQFADRLQDVANEINYRTFKPNGPWGLVVYRTAYSNDAAWNRMLDELHDSLEGLPYEPAPNPELYHRHRFEIMDDQSQFEGATIDALREKFSAWVRDEYRINCKDDQRPSDEELDADMAGRLGNLSGGTRYNFFLVVDEICLESLDQQCGAVVKLVQRVEGDADDGYSKEEIEEIGPRKEYSEWEGGITEGEFENVGWMYIETSDYVAFQDRLVDAGNWEDEYLRPPRLRFLDGFESAPGSWRR